MKTSFLTYLYVKVKFFYFMKCKYCTNSFNSQRALSIHLTRKHPDEKKKLDQKEFQCLYCDKSYDTYVSLSRHATRTHNLSVDQVYVDFYLNGIWPLCQCGCGEIVNMSPAGYIFRDYKVGHSSRIKNNWGHNETAKRKSIKTRREKFNNGELEVWNKV